MSRIVGCLEEGIISLLLAGMTLLVFVEVVLRFVFNTGFIWMQELTLLISAWFVLFGASYGVKVGAHIGVDAVVKLMPDAARRVASIVAVLLCLVYCALFLVGGWIYLSKVYKIGIFLEDMDIPMWAAKSILFVGFCLLVIRFLELLWDLIKGRALGIRHVDEASEALRFARRDADDGGAGERSGA